MCWWLFGRIGLKQETDPLLLHMNEEKLLAVEVGVLAMFCVIGVYMPGGERRFMGVR